MVREKVTGLSCTNHKMPLNSIFFLEGSLALVMHTNGSAIFVRFCKSGGKEIPNGMVHPGEMCAMSDICIQVSASNCNASVPTARHFC